jgi:hypothetical protein
MVLAPEETALSRLFAPIVDVLRMAGFADPTGARRIMVREMHRHQTAFWAWDEPVWSSILGSSGQNFEVSVTSESGVRIHLLVLAYQLCGLRRLHRRVGMVRLPQFAHLVFGHGAVRAAVDEVNTTLVSWRTSKHAIEWQVTNATLDLLLTCGSPRPQDVREAQAVALSILLLEIPAPRLFAHRLG